MAFTNYESQQIREALLKEARRCAVTLGMRKTSVEQLTQAAGISKGSFYKFYESKELLFFTVLEDVHTEVYQVAEETLRKTKDLPPVERGARTILAACRKLSETGAMTFIENDARTLLQRLPEKVKAEHYHDDEVHIRALLEEGGLIPPRGHGPGRRHRPGPDPDRLPPGADRRPLPPGAGNPGPGGLPGTIPHPLKAAARRLFQSPAVSIS